MRLAAFIFAGILVSSAALAEAPLPDYEIVPLTKADVDFYMDILRAAAAHNAHLTGDDKAAVDFTIDMQKHPPKEPKGPITQADMDRICARVQKRPPMAPFNGFGKRLPSEAPPVLTPTEREKLKLQAEADGQVAVGGGPVPSPHSGANGAGGQESPH